MTIAIIIIVILSIAVAFLLWVLRVVLKQNEGKDFTYEELMSFAQSVTNIEVTNHEFMEWKKNIYIYDHSIFSEN